MIQAVILILLVCSSALAQKSTLGQSDAASDAVAVARSFLPPDSELATLYTFNYRTLSYGPNFPAVLTAHIMGPSSHDIVFAYYSPRANRMVKTLFVVLLHGTPSGYRETYVLSYRAHVLLVSKAIRIVRLQSISTDAVAIITGMGASLGGRLEVFVWRDPWGWQNIFPPNGSMHYFYLFPQKQGTSLIVALSASKHPGLNVSPPPFWYRWDGKRFVKIPPPPGSSSWPLPD
jgi:hypothetical protein